MKKLYLRNWCFNASVIMSELEQIVLAHGGKLIASYPHASLKELCDITCGTRHTINRYGEWLYLHFVLDGMVYYVQLDDNPFFEFYWNKSLAISSTTTNHMGYLRPLPKHDIFGEFNYYDPVVDEQLHDIALRLFDYMVESTYFRTRTKLEKFYYLEEV